ncbi:hypothetical protein ACIF6K_10930 [Streptomyces sp. NPDC085942]
MVQKHESGHVAAEHILTSEFAYQRSDRQGTDLGGSYRARWYLRAGT